MKKKHALSFASGWEDYGKAYKSLYNNEERLWSAFIILFANLQYSQKYSYENHDREIFWTFFIKGANSK